MGNNSQYFQEIDRQVKEALIKGIPPPQYIRDSRNRSRLNPAYTQYQNEISKKQKQQAAAEAIKAANLKLASPGVLGRTVADYLNKKTNPTSFNPEQQRQIDIVRLNQQVQSGNISISEYQKRLDQINQTTRQQQKERTIYFGRTRGVGAQSEALQQQEARSIAASTGVAIGTIGKKETSASVASKTTTFPTQPENIVQVEKPSQSSVSSQADDLTKLGLSTIYNVDQNAPLAESIRPGGIQNPFKGKQPNKSLVSPYLTAEKSFVGFSSEGKLLQGPPRPYYLVNTTKKISAPLISGKVDVLAPRTLAFLSEESAGEYVKRVKQQQQTAAPTFISTQLERLSESAERLAFDKTKDPLSQLIIGGGKFVSAVGSSLYNVSGLAYGGLYKLVTGKDTEIIQVSTPKTLSGEYLGAQFEGISKAIETGDRGELFKGSEEAKKRAFELYQKQGPFVTVGEVFSESVGIPLSKLSPVKVARAFIPVEEGVKNIGTTLRFGYGKLSKPIVSKIGGKYAFGSGTKQITKEAVKELFPSRPVNEFSVGTKAFEVATAQDITQTLLTTRKGLQSLADAGKILPSDVKFFEAQRKLASLAGLAQRKIKPIEYKQVEELPRGTFEGLETVTEEEAVIEKIVPKTRPVKGSQIFFTQLRKGLRPFGLVSSDIDVDYIGGLLGERYATNQALKITRNTVKELNDIMSQQRAAVASGTKVFTGKIIEGVVFPASKSKLTKEQLQGGGTKLAEYLTSKDVDQGTNSIINDVSKIFGVKKSKKVVKVPTGYTGLFGKKYRKELTLSQQLLNQVASATRIQAIGAEAPFRGEGAIPFLKKGFKDLLRTESGFRVGPDIFRLKDLARQQPVALQLAELLESKGYTGKVQEVKDIFKTIKEAKPEIDFDAAFQDIEKIAESENIPSIASAVGRSSVGATKEGLPLIKIRPTRPSQKETEQKSPSVSQKPRINLEVLDSIVDISPSTVKSLSSVSPITSTPLLSYPSLSKSVSNKKGKSSVTSRPSTLSILKPSISKPSIGSPVTFSPASPGSPSRVARIKSPFGKVQNLVQPGSPTPKQIKIAIPYFFKFLQVKNAKLPAQSKRQFYVADIPDPLRAGVFAPKGVKKLISSNPKVFRQIDIDLARARRNIRAYDPLNSFKIAKSGRYTYSSKNLLNSYAKIKI